MAKITFINQKEYFLKLRQLEELAIKGESLERAVAAGAAPVADEIRKYLDAIPTEPFRRLRNGDKIHSLSESEKNDLESSFGLAPIDRKDGFVSTKAGFDGYGSHPTKSYPQGVPNQLVARAVESGSSVRSKKPFVRPAVNASRKKAIDEMNRSIDNDIKKIFEGG